MSVDSPEIAVGTVAGGIYLGLCGRATQRTCPTADQLVSDYLSSRPSGPTIVLDLEGCDWIDSTFAGWLVRLSKRMERTAGGRVHLSGCNDRCRESLEKMHLASMFALESVETPADTQLVACTTLDRPSKDELKLMLEAHEALAGTGPENERVFGPIITTLRNQIETA